MSMFDVKLRAMIDPTLIKIARKLPVKANTVTVFALLPALLAFICILDGAFIAALIFILLNRLCDGLDGTIARLNTPTKRGGFLDITCDFIFYGLIPLGFAFYDFDNAPASALLLFAFYLNGGAFLANALLSENTSEKAFSYMAGLAEGAETMLFFTLFCLFPDTYAPLAFGFAGLCLVSAGVRIYAS